MNLRDSRLNFNENSGDFILVTRNGKVAQEAGLTLSRTARGPGGEPVYFTQVDYAALPFWDQADHAAQMKLLDLKLDYEASFAKESSYDPPRPKGLDYLPFQRAGVSYAMQRDNSLIGDEPGLGKTVQAIGVANAMEATRVLVVCPASIRLNWEREIRRWSTVPNVRPYVVYKSAHGVSDLHNYIVVSYDLTRNTALHEALREQRWDLLILDEAHYLKSTDARRTQAVFGGGLGEFRGVSLSESARKIVALTGTPLPNRPRECYTLARALCPDSIDHMSYERFCYRFNPSGRLDNGHVLEQKGRLPELQSRLRCNFMVRRAKEDVLTDLPDKRYEFTYVEETGAIKQVLAKERLLNFTVEDLVDPFSELLGHISTLRREMGLAKIPRILEHVRYLLDIVELPKLVMFSHHRQVMDILAEKLSQYGIVQVRGGMSTLAKQTSIDQFVADPKTRIFSGQLDAAGFGIDGLQKVASHVVFAEPAWTPGTNEQAVDRCHRHGQHGNVLAQFLVVESSLDERVLRAVLEKTHNIHEALDRR